MNFEIQNATLSLGLEQALDLRRSVLCGEFHLERFVAEAPAEAMVLLASLGAKPVGSAWVVVKEGRGLIGGLVVLPNFRKKGLGAQLLGALEAEARKKGAKTLHVVTPLDAKPLFLKLGFRALEGKDSLEKSLI